MLYSLWFILGSLLGSFLGVYITRFYKYETSGAQESIFFPKRSYCPRCNVTIRWYDNIPIFSYLMLRGQCRACHQPIPWFYPIIEGGSGVVMLSVWMILGKGTPWPIFVVGGGLVFAMLAVSIIDIKTFLIPDAISLGGIPVALIISTVYPQLHPTLWKTLPAWLNGLSISFLGLLAGGGCLYGVAILGKWMFKKEAMGWGDIKLLAMLGALLGYRSLFFIMFSASLSGTLVSCLGMLFKQKRLKDQIAFGPFLALGGVLYFFYTYGF